GMPDPEKMKRFTMDLCTLCGRVGETSRRAAHEVEPLLPEGKRIAFADEVKLRSFPRIYGASHVAGEMKGAAEMKDLSGEQRGRVKELEETYQRELAPV